jgi:hypothetical protein
MTSRDFCFWLQGFFELEAMTANHPGEKVPLTGEQGQAIKNHLALVFKHEIDPSMGPQVHQDALNHLHHGDRPDGVTMRC